MLINNRQKEESESKEQIGLDIPKSRFSLFGGLKRISRRVEKNFTVLPYWRNGYIWSAITTVVWTCIITFLLIIKFYSKLPPEVPLVYDIQKEMWECYPKIFLYAIPSVLIIFGLVNIKFLQQVYYMNKKLTLMICLLMVVVYFFQLIAVNEILIITTT